MQGSEREAGHQTRYEGFPSYTGTDALTLSLLGNSPNPFLVILESI